MNRQEYPCNANLKDCGPKPLVTNVNMAAQQNRCYRTALWTGGHLQLTLMCIPAGGDIGLEAHPHLDQYIRVESGCGTAYLGSSRDRLHTQNNVRRDCVLFVPAGTWHNLVNTGNRPLKVSSVYAPPQHPHGTVHQTKEIAEAAEH